MAVLEAFVYDPLLNWRLIEGAATHGVGAAVVDRSKSGSIPSVVSASASTSVISEGVISESDTLPEAANNSLDMNLKKQSSSENGMLVLPCDIAKLLPTIFYIGGSILRPSMERVLNLGLFAQS